MRLGRSGLLAMLALCGCASAPAPELPAGTPHNLVVVSLAADRLVWTRIGPTAFSSEEIEDDVASWRLDQQFKGEIADAASDAIGADVLSRRLDLDQIANLYKLDGAWDQSTFSAPESARVASYLRDFAERNKIDGILLLLRGRSNDDIGGSGYRLRGLGLYNHAWSRALYANLDLYYIDGVTGYPKAMLPVALAGSSPPQRPRAELPADLKYRSPDTINGADHERLRPVILGMLDESLLQTTTAALLRRVMPAVTPLAPPPQPAPAPAVPPPRPAASAHKTGDVLTLRSAVAIYSRPRVAGASAASVDAGAALTLQAGIANDTGRWWYAEYSGGRGWVRDGDLVPGP